MSEAYYRDRLMQVRRCDLMDLELRLFELADAVASQGSSQPKLSKEARMLRHEQIQESLTFLRQLRTDLIGWQMQQETQ